MENPNVLFFTCYRHYDVMCYNDYSFVTGQFDMAKLPFLQKLHNMGRIKYFWFTMRLITPHFTSGHVSDSRPRSRESFPAWISRMRRKIADPILWSISSKVWDRVGIKLVIPRSTDGLANYYSTVPIVNGMYYSFKWAGFSASLCMYKQN